MPPPRASRLASRKSVLPDPSLYDNLTDSDDDRPKRSPRTATRSTNTTTTTTTTTAAHSANPPTPHRAPAKRRTRASLESADERPPAKQSKAASAARAKADAGNGKGKQVVAGSGSSSRTRGRGGAAEEEEYGSEEDGGTSRPSKAGSSRTTKKAKTGTNGVNGTWAVASTSRAVDVEEDDGEEPKRRGFVVSRTLAPPVTPVCRGLAGRADADFIP